MTNQELQLQAFVDEITVIDEKIWRRVWHDNFLKRLQECIIDEKKPYLPDINL